MYRQVQVLASCSVRKLFVRTSVLAVLPRKKKRRGKKKKKLKDGWQVMFGSFGQVIISNFPGIKCESIDGCLLLLYLFRPHYLALNRNDALHSIHCGLENQGLLRERG